jgi:hypothetical protein
MATTGNSCFWLANLNKFSPLKPLLSFCFEETLYRTFHGAFYQVSIHLAQRFQRRIFFRYRPIRNKNCPWWPCLLTDRKYNEVGTIKKICCRNFCATIFGCLFLVSIFSLVFFSFRFLQSCDVFITHVYLLFILYNAIWQKSYDNVVIVITDRIYGKN